MTSSKYLNFLRISLLTLVLNTSCQAQTHKEENLTVDIVKTTRQIFWDSLPEPIGDVNDFENIYTVREKQILDSLINAFERKTTIQIAIVTLDTKMTTADSIDILTLHIANTWGVGQKNKNNGITIGISKAYRHMRIQNGYGIESVLTDSETKEIIEKKFIPSFRDSNYFEGTYNGLLELMKILEQRYK